MTEPPAGPDVEGVLLAVVNDHIWFGPANACKCGWQNTDEHTITAYAHRSHVAAMQAAALPPSAGSVPPAGLDVEGVLAKVREDVAKATYECVPSNMRWAELDEGRRANWLRDADAALTVAAAALTPVFAQQRAEALREAASEADSTGHHWSGAPALAFFALAGDLRARADRIAPTTERTAP